MVQANPWLLSRLCTTIDVNPKHGSLSKYFFAKICKLQFTHNLVRVNYSFIFMDVYTWFVLFRYQQIQIK